MMDNPNSTVLMTISTRPTLEEPIIDWLLERESGPGFSSWDTRGHSSQHGHLSVAEQVSGRQRRLRFEVLLRAGELTAFVEGLEQAFAGADLHYWASPVLASGSLATGD